MRGRLPTRRCVLKLSPEDETERQNPPKVNRKMRSPKNGEPTPKRGHAFEKEKAEMSSETVQ